MNRKNRILLTLASLLLASLPAAAATGIWTTVGSTGTIDESAVSFYSFGGTNLTYLPASASVSPIVARYNVTKTWGASDTPPWTVLEMGYVDPGVSSSVTAAFIQVDPCTGAQTVICSMTGVDSTTPICNRCTFPSTTVNFANKLYYVQVTLTRSVTTVSPQLLTLVIQ